MYIDSCTVNNQGKPYVRHLLRHSYRENGKVKKETIANLSSCSSEEIAAIKLAFKHKDNLGAVSGKPVVETIQGKSVGAVLLLHAIAKRIGLTQALGHDRMGKLALWQVLARIIDQGSRLSSVRLAVVHALSPLGLEPFNEDCLYDNLKWLSEQQEVIENRLFQALPNKDAKLFLYDVTSSYLEGECNELAAFGYNRDGKKGKLQIVIGLLCNSEGIPLTVQVFEGNTNDPKTLEEPIKKARERFGVTEVIFVGDRGMIKSAQIETIKTHGFHYITAITKPQIETLIKKGVIQLSLFESELVEVTDQSTRYVLRKNPVRLAEIEDQKHDKLQTLKQKLEESNQYLKEHKRAKPGTQLTKLNSKAKQLKIDHWITLTVSERSIQLQLNKEALAEDSRLDGCYVLKTELSNDQLGKQEVHDRYKDLIMVEQAFRTFKTSHLELRPIFVRRESSTRGHVFVVMLAYRLILELKKYWADLNITVEEGISALTTLCLHETKINGTSAGQQIPKPNALIAQLFKEAKVSIPNSIEQKEINVYTKMTLPEHRKKR